MTTCQHCADGMLDEICMDVAPPSEPLPLACTRPMGHQGDHIACGLKHNLARWTNDTADAQQRVLEGLSDG